MALRDINLIPADIQTHRILNRHLAFWAGCLMFSLSLIFSFYLYEKHVGLAPNSTSGSLRDAHTHLGLRIQESKQIQEEVARLDQQQAVLKDITRGPVSWRIVFKLAEIMNESTWLQTLATDDPSLKVTGFVEDVRPVFKKCAACLLPLESGSGFRGRTVELLASGVPVVGTTNALQSVRISHRVNGIIADTDEELVQWSLKLLADKDLRRNISFTGKEFVESNYSLEATFGKLSEYFAGKQL